MSAYKRARRKLLAYARTCREYGANRARSGGTVDYDYGDGVALAQLELAQRAMVRVRARRIGRERSG